MAFAVFTTGNTAGLFLTFGAGLLLGVAGRLSTRYGAAGGAWVIWGCAWITGAVPQRLE